MIGLVLILLCVICFGVMFRRSVVAGHGKLLFWLLWMCFGIFPVVWLGPELRIVAQGWAWLWVAGVIGLPIFWFVRWSQRREARPR